MASKAKRHTHKYQKVQLGFGKVWACALPDCNHYMPSHMTIMVEGKNSLCWGCNESMILDITAMMIDRPICDNCLYKQKEIVHSVIDKSKLSNVLSDMGLFNEPTDDLDDLITKTFIKPESK